MSCCLFVFSFSFRGTRKKQHDIRFFVFAFFLLPFICWRIVTGQVWAWSVFLVSSFFFLIIGFYLGDIYTQAWNGDCLEGNLWMDGGTRYSSPLFLFSYLVSFFFLFCIYRTALFFLRLVFPGWSFSFFRRNVRVETMGWYERAGHTTCYLYAKNGNTRTVVCPSFWFVFAA